MVRLRPRTSFRLLQMSGSCSTRTTPSCFRPATTRRNTASWRTWPTGCTSCKTSDARPWAGSSSGAGCGGGQAGLSSRRLLRHGRLPRADRVWIGGGIITSGLGFAIVFGGSLLCVGERLSWTRCIHKLLHSHASITLVADRSKRVHRNVNLNR
jgi:hypothetical protein